MKSKFKIGEVEQNLNTILITCSDISSSVCHLVGYTKDIEFTIKDIENFGYAPDQDLQNKCEDFVTLATHLQSLFEQIQVAGRNMIQEFGWEIIYDDKREEWFVEGPVEEDKEC